MTKTKLNPVPKIYQPGLMERGKIKIGQKGQWKQSKGGNDFQLPQKLDYFKVVTLQRGEDGNFLLDREVHKLYGDRPTELKIWLLFDDLYLNFQSRLTQFSGQKCVCQGDGEISIYIDQNGEHKEGTCPCGKSDPRYTGNDACKINSKLSCQISGVESVGGVYTFRTTSYNSFQSILSSLVLIKRITCGPLAQIPLLMQLRPKTVTIPTTGKTQVVYVVTLEYAGTIESLQSTGEKIRLQSAEHMQRLEAIEARAAQIVSPGFETEPQEEVAEEFYPETVQEHPPQKDNTPSEAQSEQENSSATVPTDEHQEDSSSTADEQSSATKEPPQEDQKAGPQEEQSTEVTSNQGNADSPQKPKQQGGRRRTKKFEVDENKYGVSELKTCGITPDQVDELRELTKQDKINEQKLNEELRRIGYNKVSFLRHNEAGTLIQSMMNDSQDTHENQNSNADQPGESTPLPDHENDETVECPERNNKEVLIDECFYCGIRNRNGFCPALGENPPDQGVL